MQKIQSKEEEKQRERERGKEGEEGELDVVLRHRFDSLKFYVRGKLRPNLELRNRSARS